MPSEALIDPAVLASSLPWLSAIANALQAGFWEECLLRAVPIAGAAMIGDRFGRRRLFIVIAIVCQALLFGAGHATSPMQPAYARAVELILPSIGFGLLYLAFGLMPAILVHFAFDVIWFAMPLFVSTASGLWLDRAIVIVLTFVPLWIVLAARLRQGRWGDLPDAARNAAWAPPIAAAAVIAELPARTSVRSAGASPYFIGACIVAGLVGLAGWLAGSERLRTEAAPLAVTRVEAERIARESLAARGVALDDSWQVMPVLEDGRSKSNQFVWEAAGDARFQALEGRYLTQPRWRVRVAAFEGDVANRAEEWIVRIGGRDEAAAAVAHQLPESRYAPSLDEEAARALAYRTVQERFGLARSGLREVSARPIQYLSRTDWTFSFQDLTVPPIPYAGSQGEARIAIQIGGSEVTGTRPFMSVPEQWLRDDRARQAPAVIVAMLAAGLTIGVLGTAAVLGLIAWTRRQFAVRAFLALLSAFVAAALVNAVNDWPARMASFTTAQPFQLQVLLSIANGCLLLLIPAAATALAAGAVTRAMPVHWSPRIAAIVGVSLGLADAGVSTATDMIRGTQGPAWPDVSPLGSYLPMLAAATGGIPDLLVQNVTLLVLLAGFHQLTRGWTSRRLLLAPLLVGAGLLLTGPPSGAGIPAWFVAGVVSGLGLLSFYILVLRHDLSLTPIAVGTTVAVDHLQRGLHPAFPGAVVGALLGAVTTILVSWWLFGLLRHAHTRAVTRACDRDDVPIGATFTSASVPTVRA